MRGYIYPVINTNDIDLNTIPDGGALIAINENGQLIKATREGISVIEGVPGPPGKDGSDGRDGLDGRCVAYYNYKDMIERISIIFIIIKYYYTDVHM